jgi:hypothetical protein
MYSIMANNLPEMPEDMTVDGFKKLIKQLIDDLDAKEALELVQLMVSEAEEPEELDICDYAVELVRQKMINRIKST